MEAPKVARTKHINYVYASESKAISTPYNTLI